eukprot:scaffold922_cov327-Pinguiococcus_pyrenoidosus.AAC.18
MELRRLWSRKSSFRFLGSGLPEPSLSSPLNSLISCRTEGPEYFRRVTKGASLASPFACASSGPVSPLRCRVPIRDTILDITLESSPALAAAFNACSCGGMARLSALKWLASQGSSEYVP